ncbi:hypothetical protein, partial [Streptococcus pseudopneumoniae]|uniref:hypothetical protein n=1 Tax=Streptococcus pseudopneumoniae TaxID=257758 RepID=UPI0019D5F16F
GVAVHGYSGGGLAGVPTPGINGFIPIQQVSNSGGMQMPGLQSGAAKAPDNSLSKSLTDATPGLKKLSENLARNPGEAGAAISGAEGATSF